MKTVPLPKEFRALLESAEASEQDTLVLTNKNRPVAVLVSLRRVDRESAALSASPKFWRIIETARQQVREGRTTSLEELEKKVRSASSNRGVSRKRGANR
jgi:antitoxin (DNA-binding transcriptional repressor) of toxin-antitoxin stability system